jgi:hypothetical protein
MATLVLENEPSAVRVVVTSEQIVVGLADGRTLSVPLAWYPRLLNATVIERDDMHLLGNGYAIEWPDLDEHIDVEGLLAGRQSGESADSLQRWLASRNVV